ncbi:MAG TPA: ATP-binding cassette domain-containing protein [Candidatus Limnocylindrales bacterium]|nr:ATP-binding cassette domain-containing protein [Candidatus Limnocylindrales bacterium]
MNVNVPALDPQLVLLLVPIILLQVGLLVAAVIDLLRDDRAVRGGNKGVWAVVIVFVNLIGPVLYFLVGRVDGPPPETSPGPGAVPGWGSPHDPPIAGSGTIAPPAPGTTPPPAGVTAASPSGITVPPALPTHLAAPAATATALSPHGAPAIAIEGLTRRYPGGVLALDALDLEVPAGSVFGLLGPNGAGKTTTLRLLAGLTRATAGRASVAGIDVATDPLAVRRRLGYLEQDPRAYGWMTGREQVAFVARLHGLRGADLDAAVDAALARVDLGAAADRRAGTYSGGMRQRLGIAGALVHRPPVVILDEPASALDPEGRRDVLDLIASLRGETTVLFSTHVLADVERICDRIGILDHGRLVVEAGLSELLDRYALPVWRVEAEPGQVAAMTALAEALRAQPWVSAASLDHGLLTVAVDDPGAAGPGILAAVASAGVEVVWVGRARPTLEDVFLRLTGGVAATTGVAA